VAPQRHGHLGEARCRAHQLGHPIVGEVLGRGVPGVVTGAEDPAPSLVIVGHQDGERPRLVQVGDGDFAAPQGGVEAASTIAVMVVSS
jgi:hypothetical protein